MPTSRVRLHFAVGTAATLFAIFTAGCVKNVTPPKKTSSETDPPPKIAVKPDVDELAAAVKAAKGDVVKALETIGAHCEENVEGKIESVDLSGKKLTTAGVGHLTALKDSLQRISLIDAYVTGDALKLLAGLPNLRKLELNRAPVTDDDLAHLANAGQLRELSLRHTSIGDEGLEHLAHLTELRHLSLSGTKITDAGLAHLGGLSKLTTLILDDTDVTVNGLKFLNRSGTLRYLHLTGTQVTASAARAFERSNPRVKVIGK